MLSIIDRFRKSFLIAYMGESALHYRRTSALFYLHLLFIPMAVAFTVSAWLIQGYTPKIILLLFLIMLLAINLLLVWKGSYSLSVRLSLIYSFVILSATVYLAEEHRHYLLYNLGIFHVLTMLLAGLVSLRKQDSILIGTLSLITLTHYFISRIIPSEAIPLSQYLHNYIAVVIIVILASFISSYINSETGKLFSNMESMNESLEKTVQERTRALVESEKLAALGGMVGGLSHEINTPLGNSVTVISHLSNEFEDLATRLTHEKLTKSQLESFASFGLESIRAAERNLNTVRNLVSNFKKIATDLHHDAPRLQNIRDELEAVIGGMQMQLTHREGISIRLDGPDNLIIPMIPALLWHVLSNLISNSLLHGFPEHRGSIHISYRLVNERLFLEYSDDGIGMDEYTLQHHFEPFFTTRRGQGGTGLGMNLVHNLLSKIGAGIQAESNPGEGVTYRISLPGITL